MLEDAEFLDGINRLCHMMSNVKGKDGGEHGTGKQLRKKTLELLNRLVYCQ